MGDTFDLHVQWLQCPISSLAYACIGPVLMARYATAPYRKRQGEADRTGDLHPRLFSTSQSKVRDHQHVSWLRSCATVDNDTDAVTLRSVSSLSHV